MKDNICSSFSPPDPLLLLLKVEKEGVCLLSGHEAHKSAGRKHARRTQRHPECISAFRAYRDKLSAVTVQAIKDHISY